MQSFVDAPGHGKLVVNDALYPVSYGELRVASLVISVRDMLLCRPLQTMVKLDSVVSSMTSLSRSICMCSPAGQTLLKNS